jgi:uncharacterized protein
MATKTFSVTDAVTKEEFTFTEINKISGTACQKIREVGMSAFFYSTCVKNKRKMAEFLLSMMKDPNFILHLSIRHLYPFHRNEKVIKVTPLQIAAACNNLKIASLLLKNGADPNLTPEDKYSPLILCFPFGNVKMAKLLLQNGATVGKSKKGESLLLVNHFLDGSLEMMDFLLEHGVQIDERGEDGYTLLMWATVTKEHELMEEVMKRGANVDSRVKKENGEEKERNLTPLMLASHDEGSDLYSVEYLISKGADINAIDEIGETALMKAVENKELEIVEFLLQKGAEINILNGDGENALILATRYVNEKMVKYLLENGADKTIVNDHGKTALRYAKELGRHGIVNILSS